ncbi:MAG TPA: sugar transferase, partial [Mesotoga sp.]|nr:sugar transferase [Mesotoga sp.]
GWAQTNYKYAATIEEQEKKLSYDLYYVKNQSVLLDLQIILKTFETVVFRKGAK